MTEILTEPVSAANVWRGEELAGGGRWIIRFTEEDFADFERALAYVAEKHYEDVTDIRAEDFPPPHLGFHTDSTDFVGLMCLRPALYGGESFVEDHPAGIWSRFTAISVERSRRPSGPAG